MNKLMLVWLTVLLGCTTKPDLILYEATCGADRLMLRAVDPDALQNHRLYTELTVGNRPATNHGQISRNQRFDPYTR